MRWAMIVLVLGAALAGCIGNDGESDEPIRKAQVTVSEDAGAVSGVVTDVAIQPLADATVTLVELELETTTEDDGSFAINEVPPGTYTLEATKQDHVPSTLPVDVTAGEVATIDFLLTPLQSAEAFQEVFELNGFLECGVGWQVRPTGEPLVGGVTEQSIALCSVPNIAQENTTNDRFQNIFELQPAIGGAVYELSWTPNSQFATSFSHVSEVLTGNFNDPDFETVRNEGGSPLVTIVPGARFQEIDENIRTACDESGGTGSECGINPYDNGWPMSNRIFASGTCISEAAGACALFQQEFTTYVTAFYNQEIDETFAYTPGGA